MNDVVSIKGKTQAYGSSFAAIHDNGTLLRRGFQSENEARDWLAAYEANPDAYNCYYYPSSIHWGADWVEAKMMKRLFARSKSEALVWIRTRQGGVTFTIGNIFDAGE